MGGIFCLLFRLCFCGGLYMFIKEAEAGRRNIVEAKEGQEAFSVGYVKRCLYLAMSIGEEMLIAGAEVHRVEDSISRICYAYGMERVDVFTITASIIVTVYGPGFGSVTQTRRIKEQSYHLKKLEDLNNLSRMLCENRLTLEEARKAFETCCRQKKPSLREQLAAYASVSGCFTLFFGGNLLDALASLIIGILLKMSEMILERLEMNRILFNFLRAAVGGLLAELFIGIGLGMHFDKITIGNIMLLIPGVAMTNALRDMFGGEMLTGLLRFVEAMILAITIACGFALVAVLL